MKGKGTRTFYSLPARPRSMRAWPKPPQRFAEADRKVASLRKVREQVGRGERQLELL